MKAFVLCLFMAAATPAYALDSQGRATGGRLDPALFTKLREHLTTAIANATLNESQSATLREAGETLRKASEARRSGQGVDRAKVKDALDNVKQLLESGAFRSEDAALVKADLEAIRKAARETKGRRRPRRSRSPAQATMAFAAERVGIGTALLTASYGTSRGALS